MNVFDNLKVRARRWSVLMVRGLEDGLKTDASQT